MLYAKYWNEFFKRNEYYNWTPVTLERRWWNGRRQNVIRWPDGKYENLANVDIKEVNEQ